MISILGWFGSLLYLLNHAYIAMVKNWSAKVYYAGNFFAASFLVISSLMIFSYQAVVINGFWAIISVLLLLKFDVAKVPLSKRVFQLGFFIIIVFLLFIGNRDGWVSDTFQSYLGWSSSYVFCLSYFLFCSKKLSHINYLLFNVYAASSLLPILWLQQNWPVLGLELCWALISIFGIFKRLEKNHIID